MDLKTLKAKLHAANPNLAFEIKDDIAFQVGRQIERIRVSRGMTQVELAAILGTKQSAISRLERGAALPSLSTLKRIANLFGTYVDIKLPDPELTSDRLNEPEFNGLVRSFLTIEDVRPQKQKSREVGTLSAPDANTTLIRR